MKPAGGGVLHGPVRQLAVREVPDPPARPCLVYPTVSFRASDLVGNETVLGYEFTLDNVAPVSDMDSANVRVIRKDGYCSQEFDPLSRNTISGDMPNDGAVVPQVFDLRARIEDDGNSAATGLKVLPVAGIDPERDRRLHSRRRQPGADRRHRRRRRLRPHQPAPGAHDPAPDAEQPGAEGAPGGRAGPGRRRLPRRQQGPRQLPLSARRPAARSRLPRQPALHHHLGLRQLADHLLD